MGITGFFFFLSFLSLVFRERTSGARVIENGNRTEWGLIRSVIVGVMNKIRRPRSGSRFVNHYYDYRPNCTARSPVYQLVITVAISEKINA